MALHPDFPTSPHHILDPEVRWFPADEALRETTMDKLMPPLVAQLRRKVKAFRDSGYAGASETSRSLLVWWFEEPHLLPGGDTIMGSFRYYISDYDVLYGKVKSFVRDSLFGKVVDLESSNTLRNLSEPTATKTVIEGFKRAIDDLTVRDRGGVEIHGTIATAKHPTVRGEGPGLHDPEKVGVQPDHRRQRVRTGIRLVPGWMRGCGILCEELSRGGFQTGLCRRGWDHFELLP
uniref:Uncharacterized protein n=1 Tax=Candidatus Kentrum sp. LFY TaxID=2126342 RepID=A0A450URQ9_9GAMM|nr:MAG: hypothetical protein BECKLFY1418B_GA0070995_10675 [Candidatus Kentron sp. LFY]